jgi:predicted small secreted protein
MRRVRLLVLALVSVATSLALSNAPAGAQEYIQNPASGEYWYCGYYSDGYWCWVPSYGGWIMAVHGWQYLPPGG